jgi:hypothetical protein
MAIDLATRIERQVLSALYARRWFGKHVALDELADLERSIRAAIVRVIGTGEPECCDCGARRAPQSSALCPRCIDLDEELSRQPTFSEYSEGTAAAGEVSCTAKLAECPACPPHTVGSGVPNGADCPCGRHFHFGDDLWAHADPIFCPSCGLGLSLWDFDGNGNERPGAQGRKDKP